MKKESKETPVDEAEETPEVEATEQKEGTEQDGTAAIPESFQSAATELVNSCTSKHCLTFLQGLISDKMSSMSDPEFSTEDMPE
jgi:hypothetical protein